MTHMPFDLSLRTLLPLVRASILRPRDTGQYLVALNLPKDVLWLMMATVATISVLVGQVSAMLLMPDTHSLDGIILANPLVMAALQGAVLVASVYAVLWIGNLLGGKAQIGGVLAVMCWLQFMMICVQVIQVAALLVLPWTAELITILGLILFLWLFTSFVATVHGFENLALVFVMILVSTLALSFALTLVLAVLGVSLGSVSGV